MDSFSFIKPQRDFWRDPKGEKMPIEEISQPNLLREIFPYTEVPKAVFDNIYIPPDPPQDFWITCTTFRDGQQARPPYTVKQIVDLYTFLHHLGGSKGVIRQCEFFLYSNKDKEAVRKCLEKGFTYPEVTGWIRAKAEDFKLVKEMGLKETGILTSISDYHIFLKLNLNRNKAKEKYTSLIKTALENGVLPRCHFEDITRADIYGFVVPFAQELMSIAKEAKVPVKIRLCDTMGYGLPFSEASLPRGIPKLVQVMVKEAGVPKEWLEWHGHNDFHKALINGVCAWLYGCAALNGTLLGFGERCGNPPIEGACIEYVSLHGSSEGMDLTVITEIAEYFKKEIKAKVPENYPFVGDNFNVTRAGIHADGVIKNEEIYNIFDTKRILNRPIGITITDKSGLAGIALWINNYLGLKGESAITKNNSGIAKIDKWVKEQYLSGRTTGISPEEMLIQAQIYLPEYFKSDFDRLKESAHKLSYELIQEVAKQPAVISMDTAKQEEYLKKVLQENSFIQLIYVTNTKGEKITRNITADENKEKYELTSLGENFSDREWFKVPLQTGKPHITDFYKSKVTGLLCITVSAPVKNEKGELVGILGFDIKFEELARREVK
jgi:isopropylmalate/homocitrate/citramalate synthase